MAEKRLAGGWITLPEAAKISGFTRAYLWMLVKMSKIKKSRRVGNLILVDEDEIKTLQRKKTGPQKKPKG